MKTENKELFYSYFGVGIDHFIDALGMLDIVALNDRLKVPDGISMRDFVTQRYGLAASEFIIKLLDAGRNL